MEKRFERNRKIYDPHGVNDYEILKTDKRQLELTTKWILNPEYKKEIIDLFINLRKQADKILIKETDQREDERFKYYPKGCCGEIRDKVIELLKRNIHSKEHPGYSILKNFVREGGIIENFWAIDNGNFFQNAIQIGNSIIDVANDTVDIKKPKVVFYEDKDNCPLKNINSLEEFAEIAEKYWGWDIYPTIFPELAPAYPMVVLRKVKEDGSDERLALFIVHETMTSLASKVIFSSRKSDIEQEDNKYGFGFSYKFLTVGRFSKKKLPKYIVDLLSEQSFFNKHSQNPRFLFRIATLDHERINEVFDQFNLKTNEIIKNTEFYKTFRRLESVLPLIRRLPLLVFKRRKG